MRVYSLITLAVAIAISGCGSTHTKDTTIATLSKKKLVLEEPAAQPLNRENTSEFYRRFL